MQVGVERPEEPVLGALRELSSVATDAALARSLGAPQAPVEFATARLPAGAWPNGSVHYVIREAKPAKPAPLPKGAPKPAAKPEHTLQLFVVPDQSTTWLTFGFDSETKIAARALSVLPAAGSAAQLATRPGLDVLHRAHANGGGFTSVQSFTTAFPDALGAMPHHGADPMVTLSEVAGDASHPSMTTTVEMPKASLIDICAAIAAAVAKDAAH